MLANRAGLFFGLGLIVALAIAFALTRWRYNRYWGKLDRHDGRDRRYYRDVLAVGGLLGLVAGFFWQPLFSREVTMPNGGGDLASFFYPIHVFAAETLHSGELPLWNPNLFGGMPFAADIQSGVFYPLNWLFWWLGRPISYEKVEMLALVHYWLAAAFAYAFGRSLGLGRWPSLMAGTLYAFSGFAVSHLGHLPMLAAAAWLPLILLAVNQAARPVPNPTQPDLDNRRPNLHQWRWAVAAGLFLSISLLAGHFQLFLYNFYAALIFWVAIVWRGRAVISGQWSVVRNLPPKAARPRFSIYDFRFSIRKLSPQSSVLSPEFTPTSVLRLPPAVLPFARLGLMLAVLGGATLIQVWPFYELGQLSVRSAISYETSNQFRVWPIGLVDLLLPNLFSPNPQSYFGYWSNTDVLGYMGLLVFPLAALALWLRPIGRSKFYPIFFVSLGIAGLIFSLAGATIFQGWFYQFIPALNLTRGAGRFLVWFNLGLAIGAAFGLQSWLDYRARPCEAEAERALRWSWRGMALAGVALLVVPLPLLYSQVLSTPGQINDLVVRGIDGLVLAVILLGLSAVLLRLFYRRTIGPDWGAFLALGLMVFDLFSARANFNPVVGDVTTAFRHDDTAAFIRSQDPAGQYRLDASVGSVTQAWQANTAQLYRLADVRGLFNPLQLASYETLWNGITSSQKDFRAVPAYNLLGARYIIARNKEDPTGPQFKLAFRDDRPGIKLNVWENSQALARAVLVHRSTLKPASDTLAALLAADFKPAELAYLQSGRGLDGPSGLQAGEEVRFLSQSANRLNLEITATTQGYVILNQSWYPGWVARLDGAEVTIEKANYAFGALYLPPGKHILELEFAPTAFTIGLIVSGLTWLATLAFLAGGLFPLRPVRKQGKSKQV